MKTMNKTRFRRMLTALALAALMALVFMVCGGQALAETAASPDGSVIFEKDGVKVTTAGLDIDPTSEGDVPMIWLDIENASGQDAFLGVADGSVNGFMADVLFIEFYEEDGEYYGSSYTFDIVLPAGGGRYGLSYFGTNVPGAEPGKLGEMEFCFTLAEDEYSWPDYTSEPVVIESGEPVEAVDIASLGAVVIDDEKLTMVFGEQDCDDWFGPTVDVYIENKTDHFVGVTADVAEADGVVCDYVYFYNAVAPGKLCAAEMSFEGDIREMKGFENLTVTFKLCEAATKDELNSEESVTLEPISVQYPPQVWGEYGNGGLTFEVQPKYNNLITVETPKDDPNGILFSVSETASLEAGGHEGAGWLLSIGKVSADELHGMLCYDMSGVSVFAKDEDGNYYVAYHPTDVRYERATPEEMQRDAGQWSMLCEWAADVPDKLAGKNGLESASYNNTPVDMYMARAAWMEGVNATLSTTEFGPVEIAGVDGAPYAEFVMQGWFWETDPEWTPDGEYVALSFPDEDVRLDFFFAPDAYIRVISGDYETLYQAMWYDDSISYAEAMQGWYYAAAERAGVKAPDESLDPFCGDWYEKIAGRGTITISKTLAPGKVKIEARWPESAAVVDTWEMTAALSEDGKLVYENGEFTATEYDEDGSEWETDWDWDLTGELFFNEDGELCWLDSRTEDDEPSAFLRADG